MAKVNEFERNVANGVKSNSAVPFSTQANIHYRVSSVDDLTANGYDLLSQMIEHFLKYQVPRLQVLDDYSKGNNTAIYSRLNKKEENKADYRRAHNFGKLVAQFVSGYTTSVPVKYSVNDKDQQDLVNEFNKNNDVKTLDNELMYDVAKYGRAYELQYRSERNGQVDNNVKLSNVFETFVVYDNSIENNPVAGLRIVEQPDITDAKAKTYTATLYTANSIITFKPVGENVGKLVVQEELPHFYNAVPIIEYSSNRYRFGWYEDVISLIDAYDAVNSDTSNYMTDSVNSLLVLSGDFQAPQEKGKKSGISRLIENIKQYGVLALQNGVDRQGNSTSVDAKYINPDFDSTASENYQQRLFKDIFMMSNVPNLADESFGGNSSGVAMRYKIFGFEQAIAQTINSFKRSLGNRYELLGSLTSNLGGGVRSFEPVSATFTPNLPYAVSEEVQMLTQAGVPLSRKTMYEQTHFTDADNEESNLEQEAEEKSKKEGVWKFDQDKEVTEDDGK